MDKRASRNSFRQSQNEPKGENADILSVIHNMMENKQKQTELF